MQNVNLWRSSVYLAAERNVSPSTQNQALSALLFLYRHVPNIELTGRIDAVRAKKEKHLPTVLTKAEVHQVISVPFGKPLHRPPIWHPTPLSSG